jgi:tetratricopeptide (TPR) repeat protein
LTDIQKEFTIYHTMKSMKLSSSTFVQFIIFLFPLFFLPLTRDYVDFNKNMFLIAISCIAVIFYAFKSIKQKKLTIQFDHIHAAVLAVAGAYIVSLLIMSPNKVESLLQPGGISTIIALTLLYFTVPQLTSFNSNRMVLTPLLLSGLLITVFSVLNMFGVLNSLPIPSVLKIPGITPAGTLLTATMFLGIISLATAKEIIMTKKQQVRSLVLFGAAFLIVLAGTVINAFRLTQENTKPTFLPTSASWAIAAENSKVPLQAIFGVGPGNYSNAFTVGRTSDLNTLDIWNIKFGSASNYLLNLFTETGILGLLAFLSLVYLVVRHPQKSLGAIATLIVLAVLPHNVLILSLLYMFLMVMSAKQAKTYSFPTSRNTGDMLASALGLEKISVPSLSFVPVTASLVLLIAAGVTLYFQSIAYRAEMYITKGILSAVTPNNQQTYDLQRKAIELNPYHSDYRIIFARTNLGLANLLSQKENPTEEDVQTITQLVVQSVNNGKIAVQLKPSASTWGNLASIYRSLIYSAQGATEWTVQSYNQAIAFNRTAPELRLGLGQVYYALKLFEPAARQFELAAQLKPDYANAWYNLANANRELGNIQVARLAYNQTLALVDPNTPDFETAKAELEALPDTIAQDQRNLEELQNPADGTGEEVETDVELTEESGPELTFPEDVAGEATESAEAEQDTINLKEPSVTPSSTITPSSTPTQ